jgi:proteasome lid subunit RPN8/RPN11
MNTDLGIRDCAIDSSETVLEEIRLAAMDGFFSLRHGGAEIGGVLFGTQEAGRVCILAHRPLECEHALGPGFTLSPKDHASLTALLGEGCRELRTQGLEPVGWYHSHTRSEISLSPQDLEIHDRHFPEPWQVALVVRPHAMQPMRAVFFCRAANGTMIAESGFREYLLPPAAPAPVESAPLADIPLPAFLSPPPPRRSRQWPWCTAIVLALGAAVFVLAALFTFNATWMPALAHELGPAEPPSVSLVAYDLGWQLQIRWDRAAEPVRAARAGTLEIVDAGATTVVALDRRRLLSGTFSYARQSGRVDIRLALDQPNGKKFEEFTGFLGAPPAPAPNTAIATAELRKELQDQSVRMRRLEQAIAGLRPSR